jgi:hypothetical protein
MPTVPSGDLCVLPNASGTGWTVSVCSGGKRGAELARFVDQRKAVAFAQAECARRLSRAQRPKMHFPDDCPCYKASDPLSKPSGASQ